MTLHVPLLPSTRHLINRRTLAQMRPGSYLINCARGGVVDEEALIEAIDSGHLRGAGIDAFDGELRSTPGFWPARPSCALGTRLPPGRRRAIVWGASPATVFWRRSAGGLR